MRKYEITSKVKEYAGRKLYQIKALKDFGGIKAGDLGGYIEKEENLSHDGRAWIYNSALVYDNARISGDAKVCNNAKVYGNAQIYDDSEIFDNAQVYGNSEIYGNTQTCGNASVRGDADICGDARICNDKDYICFKGFGSKNRNTTMFRIKNGDIVVKCGCFIGNLTDFEEKVKKTHGNTKYAKEYLVCIEVAKIHFEIDG